MNQEIIELITSMKAISPKIWAIHLKQVYLHCYGYFGAFVILAIMGTYSFFAIKSQEAENDPIGFFILGWLSAILGILAIVVLLFRLNNPDYYAIQLLFDQIKSNY